MKKIAAVIITGLLAIIGVFVFLMSRASTKAIDVMVGEVKLSVLVADSSMERTRGLSGTHVETLGADGMLFVFSDVAERTFWMIDMNYPLDVLWIEGDKVVKISENVPVPSGTDVPRMYSDPFSVDKVLELPAGKVQELGLKVGDQLSYLTD